MSDFQISGIASGISWEDIIDKTLEQARKPAKVWENKIDTLEYKRSLYQEMSSNFFKLRSSLTTLKLESTYKKKAAEFAVHKPAGGDAASIIKANPSPNADISRWSIRVDQLAVAQRHITKQYDPTKAVGVSGSFRLQVGVSTAILEIEDTDTIRDINQKINKLKDQDGNPLAVKAMLIDNRLVIESALTGKNTVDMCGDPDDRLLSISDTIRVPVDPNDKSKGEYALMYLPRSENGTYPKNIIELKVADTDNNFREGTDYIYNSDEGLITWLPGGAWPSEDDLIQPTYQFDSKLTRGNADKVFASYPDYDLLPALPTGGSINISDKESFVLSTDNGTTKLVYGQDYEIIYVDKTSVPPGAPLLNSNGDPLSEDDPEYDPATAVPVINWLNPAKRPAKGDDYTLTLGANVDYKVNLHQFHMSEDIGKSVGMRGNSGAFTQGNYDLLAPPVGGGAYDLKSGTQYEIVSLDGKKTYKMGVDFKITDATDSNNDTHQVVEWLGTGDSPANGESYMVRQAGDINISKNSLLNQLGLTTIYDEEVPIDPDDPGGPKKIVTKWKYDNYEDAQDALINVNGVDIIRHSNEISGDGNDAIIANVKLELMGVGEVTMDVTQDASEAIEAMNNFVEAYNVVIEWINEKLEEKYDANTVDDDSDYLQSILSASRGTTVFGPLHGDQLLWSIKNQMRTNLSNPISSLSSTLRSRKFLDPKAELSQQGSFYINVGGNVARIDIDPKDSLQDIQNKLNYATSINNGDNQDVMSKKEMKLDVEIVDGQLVIKTESGVSNTGSRQDSLNRSAGSGYDLLNFVPQSASPVNGILTVYQGTTKFTEGVDFNIETEVNSKGILESRIAWLETGKSPTPGVTYNVDYEYNPSGVHYEMLPYGGDLSTLDLHYDTSKTQLSSLGISTESFNYGKSGLIEFDEDTFFEAMKDDSQLVSNIMTSFMRDLDDYIGNLVDSSNVIIGGQIVTKGRIATALNSIDTEVSALSEQINKLERQLAEKQTAMYKQYSDMEQYIQTMNSQMASLSQYMSQMSSS